MHQLLSNLSLPRRFALIGAIVAGSLGAVAGLVIGLIANPPTAPFGLVELGLPSSLLGALIGLSAGAWLHIVRKDQQAPNS